MAGLSNFKTAGVPYFYYIADETPIVPAHIWSTIANPVTYLDPHPVGTGPYTMSSCSAANIQYKNPDYWQPGLTKIETVNFPSYLSNNSANADRHAEAIRVMDAVGLHPAEAMLSKYPYELSGGQRQRIGFAQALALRPKLIVADEPVSMLDVSIRVGVLKLMADLRAREDVSILYITHDLASARYVADRVIVMYAGHIVEVGPAEQAMAAPRHPYTQLLLSAVPDPKAPREETGRFDAAEPPKVVDPAPGCRFEPRCPLAIDVCRHVTPQLGEVAPSQFAACHVALMQARAGGALPADRPSVEA